jgi:hypothetical protein
MTVHEHPEKNMTNNLPAVLLLALLVPLAHGCGEGTEADATEGDMEARQVAALSALIGPAGGELVGEPGGPFGGVRVEVPEGALDAEVELRLEAVRHLAERDPIHRRRRAAHPSARGRL